MKLIAILAVWITSFLIALFMIGALFLLSPAFIGSNSIQSRFLIIHDSDVEILTISQVNEQFPNPRSRVKGIDIYVDYQPTIVGTPIPGWFEIWEKESFLASEKSLFEMPRIGIPKLTPNEKSRAYHAILAYAQADPQVARLHPGQTPVTRFAPHRFFLSLIRVFALFGFPTLAAYLIHRLFLKLEAATIATRRKNKRCIHCAYDCTDIPSPTCPECGGLHTISTG